MEHNEWKVIYGINLPVLIQERRGGGGWRRRDRGKELKR